MGDNDDLFFSYAEEITKLVQSVIDSGDVAENIFICFYRSSKKFHIDRDVTDWESRPAFKLQGLFQINNRVHWELNDASISSIPVIIIEEYS